MSHKHISFPRFVVRLALQRLQRIPLLAYALGIVFTPIIVASFAGVLLTPPSSHAAPVFAPRVYCAPGYYNASDQLPCLTIPGEHLAYKTLHCLPGYVFVNYNSQAPRGYYEACVTPAYAAHLCLLPAIDTGYQDISPVRCVNTGKLAMPLDLASDLFADLCQAGGYVPCLPYCVEYSATRAQYPIPCPSPTTSAGYGASVALSFSAHSLAYWYQYRYHPKTHTWVYHRYPPHHVIRHTTRRHVARHTARHHHIYRYVYSHTAPDGTRLYVRIQLS